MTEPFDVQALYQAADLPLPPDPVQAQRLWASLAADLAAAADEIKRMLYEKDEDVALIVARAERAEAALRDLEPEALRVIGFIEEDNSKGGSWKRLWIAEDLARGVIAALASAEGRVAG